MTRFASISATIRLAVAALFGMAAAICSAQSCNSSINIPDSNKTTIITAWDGNGSSVLSCGDAEMLREKLYHDQLSFLDDTQQNSAAQMTQQINNGVSQLAQLQQQAASAQSAQTLAALNLTLQSSMWLYNKTELLICIFGALEAAGIPECVKTAYDFYESSKDSFEALQSVDEAHATAVKIQALISALRTQINALGNAPIPGSRTQAKYETMCRNYTQQITTDCVNSASANQKLPVDPRRISVAAR
jgi:hypothetical protein